MARLAKLLVVALAVSFTTRVHGQNSCLAGPSAQCTSGTSDVDLSGCRIEDVHTTELQSCLNTIGRSGITVLDLSGNELATVPSDLFELMDALVELRLEENELTTVQSGLFDNLGSLLELRLETNAITTIDADAFTSLTSLEILRLEENALTTVQSGLFDDLGSLLELRLETNAITTIDADAFTSLTSLEILRLEENALTTLPGGLFDSLGSLTSLRLQTNVITTIDPEAFVGLAVIDVLRLEENALTTLPVGLFDGLGSLRQLWLQRNSMATLDAGIFTGLTSLELLYLHENALTTVQAGLFDDLVSLDTLWLHRNAIGTIDVDAFANLASLLLLFLHENQLTTIQAGLFDDLVSLQTLRLDDNQLATVQTGLFDNLGALVELRLNENSIETIDADAFTDLASLQLLRLSDNQLKDLPQTLFAATVSLLDLEININQLVTLPANLFDALVLLEELEINENQLQTLPENIFVALGSLEELELHNNQLETLPSNMFAALGLLEELELNDNILSSLPVDAFTGLPALEILLLNNNALTTLPVDIFEEIGSASEIRILNLDDNLNLQCVPTADHASDSVEVAFPSTAGICECIPDTAVSCGPDETCTSGAVGYNCVPACTDDSECDTGNGEECCPVTNTCEVPDDTDAGACGDPHMTGFRGQKFDFTGEDNGWYAVVSDLPYVHLNMRITSPVPSVPEITYITGISIVTTDPDGLDHSIVISVADPHSLESSCPVGVSPCLAQGALNVLVDGEEVMGSPGEVIVAPGVAIAAVNLPGPCRSFGFEKYWERKKLELRAQSGRMLRLVNPLQDMSDWVLSDPTATNIVECTEYVARATAVDGVGMFAHQSEHASFQIMTPTATLRVSHGRLHQLPMRDPTDQFDLPDHLTWQMNMAIDHYDMSLDATGILGETLVPTVDANGSAIMRGMDAIRGTQEDYRVKGPLGVIFSEGQRYD